MDFRLEAAALSEMAEFFVLPSFRPTAQAVIRSAGGARRVPVDNVTPPGKAKRLQMSPGALFEPLLLTEPAMNPLLWLIDTIITLYIWLLIASAILSWLVAFNVVNTRNPVVANIGEFLYRVTEPALRPIRAILPNLGGIDISGLACGIEK